MEVYGNSVVGSNFKDFHSFLGCRHIEGDGKVLLFHRPNRGLLCSSMIGEDSVI